MCKARLSTTGVPPHALCRTCTGATSGGGVPRESDSSRTVIGCRLVMVRARRIVCSFFFFQAEDGIRDYKVTGVQTCALPILGKKSSREKRVHSIFKDSD